MIALSALVAGALAITTSLACVTLIVRQAGNDPLSNRADRFGSTGAGDVPIHNGGMGHG